MFVVIAQNTSGNIVTVYGPFDTQELATEFMGEQEGPNTFHVHPVVFRMTLRETDEYYTREEEGTYYDA